MHISTRNFASGIRIAVSQNERREKCIRRFLVSCFFSFWEGVEEDKYGG